MEETIPQCSKLCQEQHLIYDRASKSRGNSAPKLETILGLCYNDFREIILTGRGVAVMAGIFFARHAAPAMRASAPVQGIAAWMRHTARNNGGETGSVGGTGNLRIPVKEGTI